MKLSFNGFWNDEDGLSIKEYITIVVMTIYIGLLLGTIVYSLIYQNSENYQTTFNNLMTIISVVDDPIKIIITAYFVTNLAGSLSVSTTSNSNSNTTNKSDIVNTNTNINK